MAVVNAIGNWLQKRHSASLTIVTAEKKTVAENLTNKDAAHLLPLFLTQTASHKESSPDQSEGDVADVPFFSNPRPEEERLRAEEERLRRAEEEQARRVEEEK